MHVFAALVSLSWYHVMVRTNYYKTAVFNPATLRRMLFSSGAAYTRRGRCLEEKDTKSRHYTTLGAT